MGRAVAEGVQCLGEERRAGAVGWAEAGQAASVVAVAASPWWLPFGT